MSYPYNVMFVVSVNCLWRGYIELIIAVIGDLLILGSAFGSNDIYLYVILDIDGDYIIYKR